MKIFVILILGFLSVIPVGTKAQNSVHVIIGTPPPWGPVGYSQVRYYYLPDVEAYYDVHTSRFIYFGNGTWIHSATLPVQYRTYDLYGGYKVVMTEYYGNTPNIYYTSHKKKYAKGYKGKPQKTIGPHPGRGPEKDMKQTQKKGSKGNDKEAGSPNGKPHQEGNPSNQKTPSKGNPNVGPSSQPKKSNNHAPGQNNPGGGGHGKKK